MEILIDSEAIIGFLSQPTYIFMWKFFYLFGWLPISLTLLWGMKALWVYKAQKRWSGEQRFMFLAIDIPRANEQSPKAVENFFSYLAGAHATLNLLEEYWEGRVQLAFSLEIVSIEGYTQFIVRTPVQFRDLVESGIYAQYPDAEITEVNDYTEGMPKQFPDEEYDVWGAEFIPVRSSAFPIKTYEEFEHQMGDPKLTYRDPMASLMDLTSSLRRGEQLWYQIIVMPIGFDWPVMGDKEVSRILKEKGKYDKNVSDRIIDNILKWLEHFSELIYSLWGDIEDTQKDDVLKMMNLKPKEKKQVEAIHNKVSKLGFETKIRMVYMARKDVMNKPKVVNGFVGYMKQFAAMDLNNLKPDMDVTATSTNYFFKEPRLNRRKNKIVNYYMKRDKTAGRNRGLMNIEELATIWHFPFEPAVKAPLIQKASRRKAEPPMSLPVGGGVTSAELEENIFDDKSEVFDNLPERMKGKEEVKGEAEAEEKLPSNLPFV